MARLRALAQFAAAALMVFGFLTPMGLAVADARDAAAAKRTPEPRLRGEAPHLALNAKPQPVKVGAGVTVAGVLRGYNLVDDFCLKPRWIVYGSDAATGQLAEIPVDDEPAQCRDHEFKYVLRFTNAGVYGVRLELRTTGSKARTAETGLVFVEVIE
jgi:hypothetical protein